VTVHNVVAPAPQPEPAICLKSAMHDVKFLRSDSRCWRYVSDLSNVTPRHLGSEKHKVFGVVDLELMYISLVAEVEPCQHCFCSAVFKMRDG